MKIFAERIKPKGVQDFPAVFAILGITQPYDEAKSPLEEGMATNTIKKGIEKNYDISEHNATRRV